MGKYFIVDEHRNFILDYGMDTDQLEHVARELGALAAWEEVG
jgi:hypothetical protein